MAHMQILCAAWKGIELSLHRKMGHSVIFIDIGPSIQKALHGSKSH